MTLTPKTVPGQLARFQNPLARQQQLPRRGGLSAAMGARLGARGAAGRGRGGATGATSSPRARSRSRSPVQRKRSRSKSGSRRRSGSRCVERGVRVNN